MNDRSYLMTFDCLHSDTFHQFCIADCHRNSVYFCGNTISTDFFYICYTILSNFFAISSFQAAADRMCGKAFCKCGIFKDFCFFHSIMMHTGNFKHTFCQSTCLVKYNIFCLCQCFQIV